MNDKLSQAMDHISDRHLSEAAAPVRHRYYPYLGAIAAVLAFAIAIATFFGPLRGIFSSGTPTTVPILQEGPSTPSHPLSDLPTGTNPNFQPSSNPTSTIPIAPSSSTIPTWTMPNSAAFTTMAFPVYRLYAGSPNTYTSATKDALSGIANAVLANTDGENAVCSPLNIYMTLSMLAEITDGNSRQQILDALGQTDLTTLRSFAHRLWQDHYKGEFDKTVLANSLWLDDGISYNQETADMLAIYYFASVYKGDLQGADMASAYKRWLNEETQGLLRNQIENIHISPDAVMMLTSTVYYCTTWNLWTDRFSESTNTTDNFYTPAGPVSAIFMNSTIHSADYYVGSNCRAIRLKLGDGSYAWLTLPNEGVDPLSVTDFYRNAGRPQPGDVSLSLPKFDISATTDLQNPLKELGITDIFSTNADFTAITSHTVRPLQNIEHSVRVSMDENGVIGSAYTVISPPGSSSPSENLIATLTLDRPFTFTIVSEEGLPLFTGIVNNPTA